MKPPNMHRGFCGLWHVHSHQAGITLLSLDRDEARLPQMALCNISLQESCFNTISGRPSWRHWHLLHKIPQHQSARYIRNDLFDMDSAEILQDILQATQTITTLDLSGILRENPGCCCIALLRLQQPTPLKINVSSCAWRRRFHSGESPVSDHDARNSYLVKFAAFYRCWRVSRSDGTK
jgi:hypothetical protein